MHPEVSCAHLRVLTSMGQTAGGGLLLETLSGTHVLQASDRVGRVQGWQTMA